MSSGAIIWLHAALQLEAIERAAIFEPPLVIDAARSRALVARLDGEVAAGNVAGALITGMQAARLGPPVFDRIPRWLLERLTGSMLASEEKRAKPGDVTVRMLAPTLHYDFALALETQGMIERFGDIRADVLLLGGSKSPPFLRESVDLLARLMPRARRVELAGLGHSASGNTDDPMTGRGARPDLVAAELRRSFAT